jgi:16S rRNA (guanine1207-N2)-methyltransferase
MRHNFKKPNHYFTKCPNSKIKLGLLHATLRGRRFKFLTAANVFSRKRIDLGTRLLIQSMLIQENTTVLDFGCGFGAVGIAAAVFYPKLHVLMVDVNKRAVWLARQNIKLNRVMNVEARSGYLYEPVQGMFFDAILTNPPISAGMDTIKAIVTEAPKYLTINGLFQMVLKSKLAGERMFTLINAVFGAVKTLTRKGGYRVLVAKNTKNIKET